MGAIDRVFRGRRPSQERPAAAIVAGLWRNGEQGAWYDPSDLSTMFQDASGTTPVYMPGQGQPDCWIGLQLDKRFGLMRGPERLTNGDFAAGSASWVANNTDATHVVTFSGGTLRFQCDTLTPALQVQQLGAMTVGKWYEITVVVSAYAGGAIKTDNVMVGGSSLVIANGQGTYRTIGVAMSSAFAFTRGAANTDITIDSISIRELPGNHRWQGTATSRPVLSARYNLLTTTEGLASAPWTINGTCTRTDAFATAPDGTLTATRIQLGTLATDEVRQTFSTSAGAGIGYTASIWLKSNTGNDQQVRLKNTHISVIDNFLTVTVTSDWRRFSLTVTNGASAGTGQLLGVTNTAGGLPKDILVWGADLRVANDGIGLPPYQRVVDANTYDTVGFPLYRKPDGVDDWMQTATVDYAGADKVTVVAATRKLSDAANQTILESSTAAHVNTGSFFLRAAAGGNPNYQFYVQSTTGQAWTEFAAAAPDSSVMLSEIDFAAGTRKVRRNGALSVSGTFPGGGTLGNYPLYFDRRAGTTLPSAARDYGTIIVGRLLTGPETAAVEKLLRQKSRAY
jgi:hypothetical protein